MNLLYCEAYPFEDYEIDENFLKYVELEIRMHFRGLSGLKEEELYGEEEILWNKLKPEQIMAAGGIGADLAWINNNGRPFLADRKPEEVTQEEKDLLQAAVKAENWKAVLHHVRGCSTSMTVINAASYMVKAYRSLNLSICADIVQSFVHKKMGERYEEIINEWKTE